MREKHKSCTLVINQEVSYERLSSYSVAGVFCSGQTLRSANMARPPKWSRDELILAFDFYQKLRSLMAARTSPEIIDLRNFLNGLQSRLGGVTFEKFHNANGVYMKLMNFRRFDPKYEGSGLNRGNKDEREAW